MNHRRVQRALFRMQLDPGFARKLRADDAEATRGLEKDELRLLLGACECAVVADPGGRRASQFLSNVSSEFPISRSLARAECFSADAEFHDAVRDDTSLPLAFGRFASRDLRHGSRAERALVALECALARARRELRAEHKPEPGQVALAPWVFVESFPAGTLALAAAVREALDGDAPRPELRVHRSEAETLLIRSFAPPRPLGLREVEAEHASPALAALLRAAEEPIARAALATACATPRMELDPVIDELVADSVLVAG